MGLLLQPVNRISNVYAQLAPQPPRDPKHGRRT
jgi:hypothetical protein